MESLKSSNEEPKKIIDPMDLPKAPNPELEQYILKVYEANPDALEKKVQLLDILNSDPFDEVNFRNLVEEFEEETEKTKSYTGQYTTIETIRTVHGQLRVYHFPESNSVKFGFINIK